MRDVFICITKQAAERHEIELTWSTEVLDVLADGYNIRYGARSLKHEVNKMRVYYNRLYFISQQVDRRVVNQLAAAFEQQLIKKGSRVHLKVGEMDAQQPTIKLQVLDDKEQSPPDSSANPSDIQYAWQPA